MKELLRRIKTREIAKPYTTMNPDDTAYFINICSTKESDEITNREINYSFLSFSCEVHSEQRVALILISEKQY